MNNHHHSNHNNSYNDGSDDELIEVNDFRIEDAEKKLIVMKVTN
jgi:hypothetical protein